MGFSRGGVCVGELKEIVWKVNNHEEAWRLFMNSLLETQEKCLPQPKMNRHLKNKH